MSLGFDSLSIELRYEVFEHVSSLRDLRALIQASPFFYRAFVPAKTTILSRLLSRNIHPDAIPDALAAVRASSIVKLVQIEADSQANERAIRKPVLDFLGDYMAQRKTHQPNGPPFQSILIPLCRLYSSVEFFIPKFTCEALRAVRELSNLVNGPHQSERSDDVEAADSKSLSDIEEGRLQRAFFRFEIYRKLFHMAEIPPLLDPWFSKTVQAGLFLPLFAPWEIEELACVCQYIVRTLENVFDKLEDDFVDAVTELATSKPPNSQKRPRSFHFTGAHAREQAGGMKMWLAKLDDAEPQPSLGERASVNSMDMLDFGLIFFETFTKQLDHEFRIADVMSRGLPFLKCYLQLAEHDRKDLTLSISRPRSTPFLHTFLEGYSFGPQQGSTEFQGDSLRVFNQGWIWAHEHECVIDNRVIARLHRFDGEDLYKLRSWGYSIWDADRLRAVGILETRRSKYNELVNDSTVQVDRRDMLSAQERLFGVCVPREVLENLSAKKDWKSEDEYELVGEALY